jgi:hypothetical protein
MVIITRVIVGLTATGNLEFVCERGCPLLPGEMPLLRELDGELECLGLPELGKHRLRRAVPNAHFYIIPQFKSEFAQHAARVDHRTRTIWRRLVPDRR